MNYLVVLSSTNGDMFVDFVGVTLIPNMHQYHVTSKYTVVLDNCSVPMEDAGLLPTHSPDLKPMEFLDKLLHVKATDNAKIVNVI